MNLLNPTISLMSITTCADMIKRTCSARQALALTRAMVKRNWTPCQWLTVLHILRVREISLAMRVQGIYQALAAHESRYDREFANRFADEIGLAIGRWEIEKALKCGPYASLGKAKSRKVRKILVKYFGKW